MAKRILILLVVGMVVLSVASFSVVPPSAQDDILTLRAEITSVAIGNVVLSDKDIAAMSTAELKDFAALITIVSVLYLNTTLTDSLTVKLLPKRLISEK